MISGSPTNARRLAFERGRREAEKRDGVAWSYLFFRRLGFSHEVALEWARREPTL